MPDIPKGHKVIDTVKDNKGFYRIIERPDGTKYSQTLKLFTEQDNDRKVRAENKSLGQFSTTNIKGNMANAMALTAVGGGAAALALHNATQGRQDKVGRKFRGAAFGSTRPQGVGLKTPAGTAGDVRGRISTDRPPAIVRSVDSFNQRGSTMQQTGNLFDQPEAPSGGNKKAGRRYTPAGTAKATGKGTRGVPRPTPRANIKPANASSRSSGPTSSNPMPKPKYPNNPLYPNPTVKSGGGLIIPMRPGSIYDVNRAYDPQTGRGPVPVKSMPSGAAQAAQDMASRSSASDGAKKAGTRYAPAGTAKATGKGTRGVPRPAPRRNFKPATGAKPTPQFGPTPTGTGAKPTPQFGPTPTGTRPYVPPGQSAVPTFTTTAPKKLGFLAKYGRTAGKIGSVIATTVGASELYDQLAPKNAPRAPWMSGGDKKAPPAQAPAATAPAPAQSGGNKPAGGQKPYEPRYFPEAGGNGNAVRKPDSYLGEAFDYSLQKGTTSGIKYLEHMFRRDKVSEDDQQRLRERFNKKVVGDQTLKDEGASRGITQNVEGKKAGMGKALLDQYRANNPGNPLQNYQGNTDYGKMRAAAEARMARK